MKERPEPGSEMLEKLKRGSATAFEELYLKYYKMVESLISRHNGNSEDTQDIFQEALFVLVKKIREPDFRLTGKISTLLFAIARNMWLKKLAKKPFQVELDDQKTAAWNEEVDGVSPQEKEMMLTVVMEKMNALEEDCKLILQYTFFQNLSHSEIAGLTGYSEGFIKVKKFRCLEYLRRMVKETIGTMNL